ncbi:hypothetical protein HDV00_011768, partial [Rhizophlyctis rosea]
GKESPEHEAYEMQETLHGRWQMENFIEEALGQDSPVNVRQGAVQYLFNNLFARIDSLEKKVDTLERQVKNQAQ